MEKFFYEEINRAKADAPYVDTKMTDLQYLAHYHEELEIILMLEGEILLTVDGQCTLLVQGDIAVVRPFQIHSYQTPLHSRLYVIKIQSSYFDFTSVCRDESVLCPGMQEYPVIYHSLMQLVEEHELDDGMPLKRLAVRCATDQLLIRLARLPGVYPVAKETALARDRDIELLRIINEYLADHYHESISLEDAAAVCHMSMYYFAHSFKKATGTTFLSYLNGYRLEQAKHLIIEVNTSFTEVAMRCGFSSIRTFNRCFQKHYKMTPTEAKTRWKAQKQND